MVATAAGAGASHEAIAAALAISPTTLRLRYQHELQHGAARRRLDVLLSLFAAARRDRAGAARRYLAHRPERFQASR